MASRLMRPLDDLINSCIHTLLDIQSSVNNSAEVRVEAAATLLDFAWSMKTHEDDEKPPWERGEDLDDK